MKTFLSFALAILTAMTLVLLMASAQAVFGQVGAIAPNIYPVFNAANGVTPVALGFVCTTTSGSATVLAPTYREDTNVTANQNPIRLNSVGRAVNGSTLVPIFLSPIQYRFALYAAGTSNTCNGVAMGTKIWEMDNVYDFGALLSAGLIQFTTLNNREFCVTGANFGAKFTAAAALLPSTGGIVDCSNLQGAQTIASDVFTGQTKPLTVIWPTGTASSAVSLTVPATMTLDFPEGGILSMASATTATINGEMRGTMSQHFAGSGNILIAGNQVPRTYPQWWGAVGDGSTNDYAAVQATINATCYAAKGGTVYFGSSKYKVNTGLTLNVQGCRLEGASGFQDSATTGATLLAGAAITLLQIGNNVSGIYVNQINVSSLVLDGSAKTGTVGLAIQNTHFSKFQMIKVRNFSSHCVDIQGEIFDVTLDHGDISGCGSNGIYVESPAGGAIQKLNIQYTSSDSNTNAGLKVNGNVSMLNVIGGEYQTNSQYGIELTNQVLAANFIGIQMEANKTYDMYLHKSAAASATASVLEANIIGNFFEGDDLVPATTGLFVQGASQVNLSGNYWERYGTGAINFTNVGITNALNTANTILAGNRVNTTTKFVRSDGLMAMCLGSQSTWIGTDIPCGVVVGGPQASATPTGVGVNASSNSGAIAAYISNDDTNTANNNPIARFAATGNGSFSFDVVREFTGGGTGNFNFTHSNGGTFLKVLNGGEVQLKGFTVATLPAAAAGNSRWMVSISDSTAIAAEGQVCVGGGVVQAIAFSDGANWKCF